MRLTLQPPDPGGAVRVACAGQVSQSRFAGGGDPLLGLIGPDGMGAEVRLDLSRVEYVDSSGLGWLVGCQRRLAAAGGRLVLCRVPPIVDQVLRFNGLEALFAIRRES